MRYFEKISQVEVNVDTGKKYRVSLPKEYEGLLNEPLALKAFFYRRKYKTIKDALDKYKVDVQFVEKKAQDENITPDNIRGLYLIPNQGRLIYDKEMPYIVKARNFKNLTDMPHVLVSHDKAYGVIAMRPARVFPKEEIFNLDRYHPEQISEWGPWGYRELYEHPYLMENFSEPVDYEYRRGVRGWDNDPRIHHTPITKKELPILIRKINKQLKKEKEQ